MMLALWQANDSINSGNAKLLLFFIGLVAVSLFANTIIFAAAAIGAAKAQKEIHAMVQELHVKSVPLLDAGADLFRDTAPKVKQITTNLLETSYTVRAKAQEIDTTLSDANQKTRKQVARLDGMVTTALNNAGELSALVHHGIRAPLKQIAGLVDGVRTTIETFVASNTGQSRNDPGSQAAGPGPSGFLGALVRGFVAGRARSSTASVPHATDVSTSRERGVPHSTLDL